MSKIKTYVLPISRQFLSTHTRSGEPTYFPEKILNAQIPCGLISKETVDRFAKCQYDFNYDVFWSESKIHTIRANYELWAKRIEEVRKGEAIISLRFWAGKPYHRDKNGIGQVAFMTLDKDSGIGVQKLTFLDGNIYNPSITTHVDGLIKYKNLSLNDGLQFNDFENWFEKYDLWKPLAIIHFTNFRY